MQEYSFAHRIEYHPCLVSESFLQFFLYLILFFKSTQFAHDSNGGGGGKHIRDF